VAEELGQARLVLTLDDGPLRKGLQDAKRLIEQELGGAVGTATRRGTAGGGGRVGRQATESINSEIAANRTLRQLRSSLNKLEAEGINTVQLRVRFFQIEKQVKDSLFGSARRNSELLKQQITDEKIKLDLQRQQLKILNDAASAGRGTGPSSPIRGGRLLTGSPANLEFLARQGGPTSPIRGGAGFPGSPIALDKAAEAERKRTRELERSRQALERQATAERRQREQQQKAGRERLTGALSNAIIGGAFPLLFGQGLGAAAGGGLGGAAGGLLGGQFGFGLSLVGTAVGAAFDTALQKGQQLAEGLDDPIKNFDKLREAAVLSSKAVEKNAEALIAVGREEEAAALIRQDLAKTFGSAENYEEFARATDELNRAWSQATVTLAQFVAGPLGDFLKGLTLFLGGGEFKQAAADVARVREITAASPQKQAEFEQLVRQRGGRLTPEGNIGGAPSVPIFREFLALQNELTQEQKEQKKVQDALNAAATRTVELTKARGVFAQAAVRGNQQEALEAEKRVLILEKEKKLRLLPEKAPAVLRQAITEETQNKLTELEEKRLKLQRDLNIESFKEFQARASIESSTANTLELLGAQRGVYRDTLRTVQGIQESIAKARQEEARIGFEIGQARIAGREEEANALVEKQRTAALQTKSALTEGALALKEAGESLRNNLREAVINLTQVRSDPGGLSEFLGPETRALRAEQDTARLLPLFRQAQKRFTALTGAPAIEFSGPREEVNDAIRDFIARVKREDEARGNVVSAQQALIDVNENLARINTDLTAATQALADKNWVVEVQVNNQAGGASTVNAINALAQ
jgi:hypothetical protein